MSEFVTSNFGQLFSYSLLDNPKLPGEINWPQVAVVTGVIIITAGFTGFVVYKACKRNQERLIAEMQESKKQEAPKPENEEILRKVLRKHRRKKIKQVSPLVCIH